VAEASTVEVEVAEAATTIKDISKRILKRRLVMVQLV
jgi:hypothetical protein